LLKGALDTGRFWRAGFGTLAKCVGKYPFMTAGNVSRIKPVTARGRSFVSGELAYPRRSALVLERQRYRASRAQPS